MKCLALNVVFISGEVNFLKCSLYLLITTGQVSDAFVHIKKDNMSEQLR